MPDPPNARLARILWSVLALIALAVTLPTSARAVHWPQQGGDAGRSGYQPVGDGAPPVRPLWKAQADVVTAPLITGGSLAEQRVIYGTADGRVHLRDLAGGGERGQPGGTQVDDTLPSGVFGQGARGAGVAFAESSGSGGLGRVFVVHNANNRQPFFGGLDDVEVAVIDEATGAVLEDAPVRGTVDHRVSGPAALSPPDAAGVRSLLFLSQAPGGQVSLVRVPVDAAGRLGAAGAVAVPGAEPRAGATVAYLGDPAEPYAAVGAGDGVRTFSLSRFPAEGPRSAQAAGAYGTPAVAVAAGGLTPGQPGSEAPAAPGLYVAASQDGMTRVHRLEPDAGSLVVRASSPPLPGAPAPAVTVAQEVVAGRPAAGWVVAGTSEALHVLDARSLQPTGSLPGAFASSVAAAVGRLAFAALDAGSPVVVDLASAKPLSESQFYALGVDSTSTRPARQPAISRGIVTFANDVSVLAFRTRCGNPVAGTSRADRLQAGVPGDSIAGFAGDDAIGGGEGDDCIDGGDGRDRLRGDDGDDTLDGGDGDDLLTSGGGLHNAADGGPGRDRLDGGPGYDRLAGGPGADRLEGGAFPDVMRGGPGADILLGGAGNDRMTGGPGADRVDAGDGNDVVDVRGGGTDRVRCGNGRDTVMADGRDRVLPGCERGPRPRPRPRR